LDETQKQSISTQLDKALIELRSLPHPSKAPLGGVSGEGCKDARRSLRINNEPIMNAAQFEDFIFAGSRAASPLYIQFLRSLKPVSSPACVLTHGDIRPANIIVDQSGDSTWRLVAIIDWENSGFYPAYWECVKMTNNLLPSSNDDWYSYLPESVSPRKYPTEWLVDRILDRSLVNS
jgi:aminoglycoside phosphotransferase (APT) family kinase protein